MVDVVAVERVRYLFVVKHDNFREAVGFYKSLFDAEVIEEFYGMSQASWVELKVYNTRIVVCTCNDDAFTGTTIVELETVDVEASLAAAKTAGALVMDISEVELLRGVKAKVMDPFGFVFSFTEKTKSVPASAGLPQGSICATAPGFLNIFEPAVELPAPVLEISKSKTEIMQATPLLFPALKSEVMWWIASRNCVGWENHLNAKQRQRLEECEFHMNSLKQSSMDIKKLRFSYKKQNLREFDSHPSLSDILSELERISAILQGVQLVFLMNPMVKSDAEVNRRHGKLEEKYVNLWSSLPPTARNLNDWPNLKDERREAACWVRQLLKRLQNIRSVLHRQENNGILYEEWVLEEERAMHNMIWHEVQFVWRDQDRFE